MYVNCCTDNNLLLIAISLTEVFQISNATEVHLYLTIIYHFEEEFEPLSSVHTRQHSEVVSVHSCTKNEKTQGCK